MQFTSINLTLAGKLGMMVSIRTYVKLEHHIDINAETWVTKMFSAPDLTFLTVHAMTSKPSPRGALSYCISIFYVEYGELRWMIVAVTLN